MDSRVYFHQYRRPRCQNPTYASNNVQNSMSFFNQGSQRQSHPANSYFMDSYSGTARDPKSMPAGGSSIAPRQQVRTLPAVDSLQRPQRKQPRKLSNIGERSLQLDQAAVYHKQSSPYNIVSLKPKEYSDDIRQYPRYSVENKDDVYYRRMHDHAKESQYYSGRASSYQKEASGTGAKGEEVIAGRHTYDLGDRVSANPEHKPAKVQFTAKMLNHMDELHHNLA